MYYHGDADAAFQLGNLRFRLAESLNEFKDYDQAQIFNPKYKYNYHYEEKYKIQHELYDYNKILAHYNRAIELNPTNPIFFKGRGKLKERIGDKAGAVTDYQISSELSSGDY